MYTHRSVDLYLSVSYQTSINLSIHQCIYVIQRVGYLYVCAQACEAACETAWKKRARSWTAKSDTRAAASGQNRHFKDGVFTFGGKGIQGLGQWYSGVFGGIRGYSTIWDTIFTWKKWVFSTLVRDTESLFIILNCRNTRGGILFVSVHLQTPVLTPKRLPRKNGEGLRAPNRNEGLSTSTPRYIHTAFAFAPFAPSEF